MTLSMVFVLSVLGLAVLLFITEWLRVDLDKPNPYTAHLSLNSKGQRLNLGRYLTADEKSEVAERLSRVLRRISMLHN